MAPTSRGGGGKLSRRAAIALIAGGGTLAISGTGAFTQAETPRRFSVTTAADENALLGIRAVDVTFTQIGQTKTILELNNQTNSTVSLDDSNGVVKNTVHNFLAITDYPSEIQPTDGWVSVKARVREKRNNQNPVEVTINARSDSTSISAVYTVAVATDLTIDGCPVTPRINVSVGEAAMSSQVSRQKVTIGEGDEVDGDVKTTAGSTAQVTLEEGATVTGDVIADGED